MIGEAVEREMPGPSIHLEDIQLDFHLPSLTTYYLT